MIKFELNKFSRKYLITLKTYSQESPTLVKEKKSKKKLPRTFISLLLIHIKESADIFILWFNTFYTLNTGPFRHTNIGIQDGKWNKIQWPMTTSEALNMTHSLSRAAKLHEIIFDNLDIDKGRREGDTYCQLAKFCPCQ